LIKLLVILVLIGACLLLVLFIYTQLFRYLLRGGGMPRTELSAAVCLVPVKRRVSSAASASMHGMYNPTAVQLKDSSFLVGYRLCTFHTGNAYLDIALSGGHSNRFLVRKCASKPPFDVFNASTDDVRAAARLVTSSGGADRTVEDVRLLMFRGEVWGVGTVTLMEHNGKHHPVLLRFQLGRGNGSSQPLPVASGQPPLLQMIYCNGFTNYDTSLMHKNWIGMQHGSGDLLVHRDTYPELVVSRVRDPGGENRLEPLVRVDSLPALRSLITKDVRCIRNTSNWISWDADTWAFLAHTKVQPGIVMLYRTALVLVCKKTFAVVNHTPWLNLDAANEEGHGGAPIQFASFLWRDSKLVYIGMGLNDSATCFQSFRASDIDRLLLLSNKQK